MLRAISGAVMNAAHAHKLNMTKNFARSVAKRATGTLTAQWPEVLAAKTYRRQAGHGDRIPTSWPRVDHSHSDDHSKGDRHRLRRRSPIRQVWKMFANNMWKVKREGTPEQFEAHVRILRLLDEAQRELDKLS